MFGRPVYAHVNQGKLALKALRCQFIGYPEEVKWLKLWCIDLNPLRCIIRRDVVFNEKVALDHKKPIKYVVQGKKDQSKVQFEVEQTNQKTSNRNGNSYQSNNDQEGTEEAQPQLQEKTQL